jgi:hypothetical protein
LNGVTKGLQSEAWGGYKAPQSDNPYGRLEADVGVKDKIHKGYGKTQFDFRARVGRFIGPYGGEKPYTYHEPTDNEQTVTAKEGGGNEKIRHHSDDGEAS